MSRALPNISDSLAISSNLTSCDECSANFVFGLLYSLLYRGSKIE